MDKVRGMRAKHNGIELRASVRGKRHTKFINKPWNKTNCATAARIRREWVAELQNGINSHLRDDNPIFRDVAQDYLESIRKRGLSKEHVSHCKNDLNKIWLPHLGHIPVKDVTVRNVRLADQGHTWSSAKRQQNSRSTLRQVFDLAIEDDFIDENPAIKLKKVSHQRAKIDPFNESERDAILQQLSGEALMYFTIAFETGMRTAELLGLDWADIRGSKAYLHQTLIKNKVCEMKTKTERNVYLSTLAQQSLSPDIRPLEGLIFTLSSKQLWRRWVKALKAAGVRYRKPYNCRHARASIGLSHGQTPGWLAKQLGHDLRTFFEHYADYIDTDSDEAEMAKLKTQDWGKCGTNEGETA